MLDSNKFINWAIYIQAFQLQTFISVIKYTSNFTIERKSWLVEVGLDFLKFILIIKLYIFYARHNVRNRHFIRHERLKIYKKPTRSNNLNIRSVSRNRTFMQWNQRSDNVTPDWRQITRVPRLAKVWNFIVQLFVCKIAVNV